LLENRFIKLKPNKMNVTRTELNMSAADR